MLITKPKRQKGVTLVELMMAVLLVAVVMWGVALMMADGIKHWGTMYNRLHSVDADNAYTAAKMFDRMMRRAISAGSATISPAGDSAYIYYYSHNGIGPTLYPDRRADFVWSSNNKTLTITYNVVDATGTPTGTTDGVTTINNVTSCKFQQVPLPSSTLYGRSIQMVLTIENKNKPADVSRPYSETLNVCSSAYLHIE